jgi:hypothetical protein
VELIPGGLAHEDTQATLTTAADLPSLLRHTQNRRVWRDYVRNRLNPFYKHRQSVLREVAPAFVTKGGYNDLVNLEPLGDDLSWMRVEDHGDKRREKQVEIARLIYSERLKTLPIDADLDGATRELLGLCRDRGIRVVLLLTPENSLFRSWYSPKGERRLARYVGRLQREFAVSVVDARAWVGDEHFCDPHHLKLSGAHVFTRRLGTEVIGPLVAPPSNR